MNSPPTNNAPPTSGSGTTDELRSDAKELGSSAKDRVQREIDARKGNAAEQAKSVSSAIERTADELDPDAPQWLKSAMQQGADQIQRFADTLEQKDSREIFNDVRTFARDNPATFLGACAAAGFAAARVFKAGGDQSQSSRSQTQGPPAQVDEPTFGGEGMQSGRETTRGEFV
ncbi:MAG: hypothetical protein M3448_09505 [Pseudomonadota bacterium]|nr:hypothetical protein [Pseudomonadota bacterium]